jgi:hypothetical protein
MKIESKLQPNAGATRPRRSARRLFLPACAFTFAIGLALCDAQSQASAATVPMWSRFEHSLASAKNYSNPVQEAELDVVFVSPQGERHATYGFWDGGSVWRVRFAPNQQGTWTWQSACSDTSNSGLHKQCCILKIHRKHCELEELLLSEIKLSLAMSKLEFIDKFMPKFVQILAYFVF